jgi:hypothetical protein
VETPDEATERRETIKQAIAPTIVAEPLRSMLLADEAGSPEPPRPVGAPPYDVIIDVNVTFPSGVDGAKDFLKGEIARIAGEDALSRNVPGSRLPYVFAKLNAAQIRQLIAEDGAQAIENDKRIEPEATPTPRRGLRAIHRIWLANVVAPLATVSIRTVKADAAQIAFTASGVDIVWAVLDSGIDVLHPHFAKFSNCTLQSPLTHKSAR